MVVATEEEKPDTRTPLEKELGFRVTERHIDDKGTLRPDYQIQFLDDKGKITHVRPSTPQSYRMYALLKQLKKED